MPERLEGTINELKKANINNIIGTIYQSMAATKTRRKIIP